MNSWTEGLQKLQSFQKKIESSFDEALKQNSLQRDLSTSSVDPSLSKRSQGETSPTVESGVDIQGKNTSEASVPNIRNLTNQMSVLERDKSALMEEGMMLANRLAGVEEKLRKRTQELEQRAKENDLLKTTLEDLQNKLALRKEDLSLIHI